MSTSFQPENFGIKVENTYPLTGPESHTSLVKGGFTYTLHKKAFANLNLNDLTARAEGIRIITKKPLNNESEFQDVCKKIYGIGFLNQEDPKIKAVVRDFGWVHKEFEQDEIRFELYPRKA